MPRVVQTFGDRGRDEEIDRLWQELERLRSLIASGGGSSTTSPSSTTTITPASQIEVKEADGSPDLFVDGLEFDATFSVSPSGSLANIAGTEVITARSSARFGDYVTLDARLEAIEARAWDCCGDVVPPASSWMQPTDQPDFRAWGVKAGRAALASAPNNFLIPYFAAGVADPGVAQTATLIIPRPPIYLPSRRPHLDFPGGFFVETPVPNAPAAGMAVHYKSDTETFTDSDLLTPATTDGSRVGGWKDQSGNARNLLKNTDARRAELKTNRVNGYPSVRFNGALGTFPNLRSAAFTFNQPLTFFIVININTGGWVSGMDIFQGLGASDSIVLGGGASTPQVYCGRVNQTTHAGEALNTWAIYQIDMEGTADADSGQIKLNAGSFTVDNVDTDGISGGLVAGDLSSGSSSVLFEFAEIIGYASVLSSGDATQTRNYLNAKYAIF